MQLRYSELAKKMTKFTKKLGFTKSEKSLRSPIFYSPLKEINRVESA